MSNLTYIDLFSGCGGLALGLHSAGWKGLFAIEKSPDAFETLKYNLIDKQNNFDWVPWLEKKNHDINEVIELHKNHLLELNGKVNLIAGGPPCQGFSMAGRRNESDDRNKLIDSYIQFVKYVEPEILFFENVKGFTIGFKNKNKRGQAYSEYVWGKLEKLGYDVHGEIVDFSEYGVPQKRQRFILVATKKDQAKSFFQKLVQNRADFFKSKNISDKTSLSDAISDLLQSNGVVESPDTKRFKAGIYSKSHSNYQKLMRRGKVFTNRIADSHRFANHKVDTVKKFQYILENGVPNKCIDHELKEKFNLKKRTVVPLCEDSCTPTLTTLPDDYIHYCEPRILTVREYARIQSFPDTYLFRGKYTTGGDRRKVDVPRYTQIGNAIPPLFGEQVGLVLREMI
jgi:DNA (cytosine-5)-methyltransferase 1